MITQPDVPRRIARVLFVLGTVWAIILAPMFAGIFERDAWRAWPITVYMICGYGVWFGWFWRSFRHPSRRLSVVIWVSSAVMNLVSLGCLIIAAGKQALRAFLFEDIAFYYWWGLAVAIASLVALCFEFRPPKIEASFSKKLEH